MKRLWPKPKNWRGRKSKNHAYRKAQTFLDASVLIAGSASLTGGSAFILEACQNGHYLAITTELILHETERNISNKLDEKTLDRFYKLVKTIPLKIQPPAVTGNLYQGIIDHKDAHVLAAAIESHSDYLLTLDRQHFFTAKLQNASLPVKIVTPKDFILASAD